MLRRRLRSKVRRLVRLDVTNDVPDRPPYSGSPACPPATSSIEVGNLVVRVAQPERHPEDVLGVTGDTFLTTVPMPLPVCRRPRHPPTLAAGQRPAALQIGWLRTSRPTRIPSSPGPWSVTFLNRRLDISVPAPPRRRRHHRPRRCQPHRRRARRRHRASPPRQTASRWADSSGSRKRRLICMGAPPELASPLRSVPTSVDPHA